MAKNKKYIIKDKYYSQINKLLILDDNLVSIRAISLSVSKINKEEKVQLLTLCKKGLKDRKIALRAYDANRIVYIKLITACLPDSLNLIQHFLRHRNGRHSHEIQFTFLLKKSISYCYY